jgi:HSP20 family protein
MEVNVMTKLAKHNGGTQRKGAEIVPARVAPATLFPRWMERFEELFADVWPPMWPVLRFPEDLGVRLPPVDVYEEGGSVVVKAELPGMKKEEIEVHLSGTELTISGEKVREEKVERKDYRRYERSAGAFRRTIALPAEVEAEKITAAYKDGVLEIRAPRVEGAEPKGRKVPVA